MRRNAWIYGLSLGCLSAFWAESTISSAVFLFGSPFSLIITLPLYALHAVLLALLVGRQGPPRLYAVYAAGMVFGLYEAYITKMIFHHTWDSPQLEFLGVSWFSFPLLVFWYHPIFAFIIPLFIVELLITGQTAEQSFVPSRIYTWVEAKPYRAMVGIGAFMGCYHSLLTKPTINMLGSLFDGLVIVGILALARRSFKPNLYAKSLPSTVASSICAVLLATIFALAGLFLRPEALPDLNGHIIIACCYALTLAIALKGSCRCNSACTVVEAQSPVLSMKHFIAGIGTWLWVSLFFHIAPPIFGMLAFAVITFSAFPIGLTLFVLCVRSWIRHLSVKAP